MTEDSRKTLSKVVQIDERRIQDHLGELVRGTVEETLNGLLDAEADTPCAAPSATNAAPIGPTTGRAATSASCTRRPAR